ncbi:hypothetical protein [Roseovarius tolerans]|nr:hypothetical protein [Roseovarius tolerans]
MRTILPGQQAHGIFQPSWCLVSHMDCPFLLIARAGHSLTRSLFGTTIPHVRTRRKHPADIRRITRGITLFTPQNLPNVTSPLLSRAKSALILRQSSMAIQTRLISTSDPMTYARQADGYTEKSPRHALLFELIRQRSMAQHVSQRIAQTPPANPVEVLLFADDARRSLVMQEHPRVTS